MKITHFYTATVVSVIISISSVVGGLTDIPIHSKEQERDGFLTADNLKTEVTEEGIRRQVEGKVIEAISRAVYGRNYAPRVHYSEDCDMLFDAIQAAIGVLEEYRTDDEIREAFWSVPELFPEDLDILDPQQLRQISCSIPDQSMKEILEKVGVSYLQLLERLISDLQTKNEAIEALEAASEGFSESEEYRINQVMIQLYQTLVDIGYRVLSENSTFN